MNQKETLDTISFSYTFSAEETVLLAQYIRNHPLPHGLIQFEHAVHETIYSTMTIAEAEMLFKD